MVERRPLLTLLAHLVLILGVAIVVAPIWVTFAASTQAPEDVLKAPVPVWIGSHLVANYAAVLGTGLKNASSGPVGPMLLNPDKAIPTPHRCAEFGKLHVHHGAVPFPDLPRF